MESAKSVIKNSFWIGIQPLALNVISLFVIGYIASTLGQEDYGRFVFAFSFMTLFMPFANLGLRAVTVRNIASNRDRASKILGKTFILRMFLAVMAFALLVIIINFLNYPPVTRTVVYIAGSVIFFNTAATVLLDGFQAFEKMEYMAYANFASGIILTILSVIALYIGYRLLGLTVVYLFGSVLLLFFAVVFYVKNFPLFKMDMDLSFWRESLKNGMPFFLTGLLGTLNSKIGIIILSKMEGDTAVGLYGAASNLIERLSVIPDSIGTAIFPTLTVLYIVSERETLDLFERFFNYIVILGLSIAVGISLLSHEIINVIYGTKYTASATILSLLSWKLPMTFIALLQIYTLNAIGLQKEVLKVIFIATIINISLIFLFIPYFHEKGVVLAELASSSIFISYGFYLIYKRLFLKIKVDFILRVVGVNILLGLAVASLRDFNFLAAIIIPGSLYVVSLHLLGLINGEDWNIIKESLLKKETIA